MAAVSMVFFTSRMKTKNSYSLCVSQGIDHIHIWRLRYVFGGRCFNIRSASMDIEPCFKIHNLVSIYSKSIKLV